MGHPKTYVARLELITLISWLLKDLSWVILLTPLAWPSALVAICLEFHNVLLEWSVDSAAVRVHGVAALLWLVGNATWMTSEFLWDASSSYKEAKRPYWPWHSGPLAGSHEQNYQVGVGIAEVFFVAGLLMLALFYIASALGFGSSSPTASSSSGGNPQDEMQEPFSVAPADVEPLVWGCMTPKVYCMIYIGPWILKDLFWAREIFLPALFCAAVVFAMMADCFRRYRSPIQAVELFWVVANSIWISAELGWAGAAPRVLGITPVVWLRVTAASLLSVGCAVAVRALWQVKNEPLIDSRIEGSPSERAALIGARAQ